jgi:Uncharacterised nucleotidyltransferase
LDLLPPRISDTKLLALLADILAVCSGAGDTATLRLRLIDRKFSWQALIDLAIGQGLIFPLIWALDHRSLLLPVPEKLRSDGLTEHPTIALEAAYRRHLARRHEQRDQLLAIIAALTRANVVPLLLKGARYLAAPTDSWCEARDMRDIDLLVHNQDVRRTVAVLEAAGYRFEQGFVPLDQHLPELWLAGCPSAVEIHTEALAFSARKILATEEVWRHGIPGSIDGGTFLVLPDEWHLLHGLLTHQISDRGHVRCLLALKALWEFAMLGARLSDQGWRSIADHMAARAQTEVLASFIVLAARLFGLAYPPQVAISSAARAHAESTLAHASRSDLQRRVYFLADKVRFGFARETMAVRYGLAESEGSLRMIGIHLSFLARRYRGQLLRRLTGRAVTDYSDAVRGCSRLDHAAARSSAKRALISQARRLGCACAATR